MFFFKHFRCLAAKEPETENELPMVADARFSVAMITLQVAATNGAATAVIGAGEDGCEGGSDDDGASIMTARREARRCLESVLTLDRGHREAERKLKDLNLELVRLERLAQPLAEPPRPRAPPPLPPRPTQPAPSPHRFQREPRPFKRPTPQASTSPLSSSPQRAPVPPPAPRSLSYPESSSVLSSPLRSRDLDASDEMDRAMPLSELSVSPCVGRPYVRCRSVSCR